MPGAARIGDAIYGTFNTMLTDHNGHYDPISGAPIHPVGVISGSISSGGSGNVFINGMPAALDGSVTTEPDVCCQYDGLLKYGSIIGSSNVIINGRRAAITGDTIDAHTNGAGDAINIIGGSSDVIFG